MTFPRFLIVGFIALVAVSTGCRKDKLFKDSTNLRFSTDTLTFDTVFTTIGSAVRSFVIYNDETKPVEISSLRIAGGEGSMFRLNVDGVPGKVFTNVRIEAKDSIYVFAAVTIDPDNTTNPFVVEDKILFDVNGNEQSIILNAWGQNAYFHYGELLDSTATWPNDKPHVIIHSFAVDSNATLTLQSGTRIYMHANSGFFVFGTLIANGTKEDSIIFQGDRLEPYFKNLPGSWGFIYFTQSSKSNELTHVIVKDALYGIYVDSLASNSDYKVKLHKCTIKNMFNSGIRVYQGTIYADNCVVYNCGDNCAELFHGGQFDFKHCTFANYGSATVSHQKPSVVISNYYVANNVIYPASYGTSTTFTNCIIYGGLEKELEVDSFNNGLQFDYHFNNCLIRSDQSLADISHYSSCIKNQDPLFVNGSEDLNDNGDVTAGADFHLSNGSPAIDTGVLLTQPTDDLDDKLRDATPDMGCYEK